MPVSALDFERQGSHVLDSATGSYHGADASSVLSGIDLDAVADCAAMPSITAAVKAFRERIGG